jgi:hypothetical protein
MSDIQVSPEHYDNLTYDNKNRFISYWHQINEIVNAKASSILEIGVGNGFVSNYLSSNGFKITTLDIDERLDPDVVGSLLDLPFEQIKTALNELYRVSSRKVIISVPDRTLCYKFLVKLPIIKQRSFMISIPKFLSKKHTFDGQHYWELGKKGFPLSRFQKIITEAGFIITDSYRIFEFDNHHIFVLSK